MIHPMPEITALIKQLKLSHDPLAKLKKYRTVNYTV